VAELATRLAPRSLQEYRRDAGHYLAYCGYDSARALDVQTLRAWLQHMVAHTTLSPNTINRRLWAIQSLVVASAVQDAAFESLAFRVRLVESVPKAPLRHRLKRQHVLTPEQVRALVHAPDPTTLPGLRDRVLLTTLAGSGCRISELLAITTSDLVAQGEAWALQVLGKGQWEPRQAPLSLEAVGWVQRWLAARAQAGVDVPSVFTGFVGRYETPTRRALQRNAAWRRLKTYGLQLGVPWLTPHDLRRFVATQVAAKHGLRQAQKALGHARLETTAAHYIKDELQPGLTEGLY
jgi:site-specific recombinase XerD